MRIGEILLLHILPMEWLAVIRKDLIRIFVRHSIGFTLERKCIQ